MQNVWRDSVPFSPGLLKSSIEYEVHTLRTHRPLAAILELASRGAAPMPWSWYDLLF